MIRRFVLLSAALFAVCERSACQESAAAAPDLRAAVVRLNSTVQGWSAAQPWEKTPPATRRGLAAIVAPGRVLTTAEMVGDATYLELQSPDGNLFAPARVIAVDYEMNLALLAAASDEQGAKLFAGTRPCGVAEPAVIGDELTVFQVEDSGEEIRTRGILHSVTVKPGLLPGHGFLTYQVKTSMQSAASSYSLPVFRGGNLASVLYSYNAKDQLCDVAASDLLPVFLKAAETTPYRGRPGLGVNVATTEDPAFRQWLKLGEDQGGLYLNRVRKGSTADTAGARAGDVLLAIDGHAIDRRGYYRHATYGSVSWGHLARGVKAVGDPVRLSLLRDGEPLELDAPLAREDESDKLVPGHIFGQPPDYLVKGGLVFQELTLPLLRSFGQDWRANAPLNLLDVLENPEQHEADVRRIVFLSAVIPTPATIGYEELRNLIVRQVNGRPVRDMASLVDAFAAAGGPLHSIRFDQDDFTIHLDEAVSAAVDAQLRQRGIPALMRVTRVNGSEHHAPDSAG